MKAIQVQCPHCGHYDNYTTIATTPLQCSICHGYYVIEEISNYSVKRLRADQAMKILVEISNEIDTDPRKNEEV